MLYEKIINLIGHFFEAILSSFTDSVPHKGGHAEESNGSMTTYQAFKLVIEDYTSS